MAIPNFPCILCFDPRGGVFGVLPNSKHEEGRNIFRELVRKMSSISFLFSLAMESAKRFAEESGTRLAKKVSNWSDHFDLWVNSTRLAKKIMALNHRIFPQDSVLKNESVRSCSSLGL
ncbi:MAG: hypothetical protein JW769_01485 [Parachlamydiales bacterium]|nr:hypothetical protein [Parachlamydiales bacterium]